MFDRRFFNAVGFKLIGETSIQSGVGLGAWGISRVREAIQEVGLCNNPPSLRNRIFTKSV